MAFKIVTFFALVASSSAGLINSHQAYSDAPSVSYSSLSTPEVTHGFPSYASPTIKVAAPLAYPTIKVAAPTKSIYAEPSVPAHYDFAYSVEDPHTGDSKTHHEVREGDVTKGFYSLIEADGTKRIVEYTVDPHSGFNAVVHKEPAQGYVKSAAPLVGKVAVPFAVGTPAYKVAAPSYTVAAPAYKVATPAYQVAAPAYQVAAPAYQVAAPAFKVAAPAFNVAAPFAYSAPGVAKVPTLTKVTYSSAPEVSYSSVSGPLSHDSHDSYYH